MAGTRGRDLTPILERAGVPFGFLPDRIAIKAEAAVRALKAFRSPQAAEALANGTRGSPNVKTTRHEASRRHDTP